MLEVTRCLEHKCVESEGTVEIMQPNPFTWQKRKLRYREVDALPRITELVRYKLGFQPRSQDFYSSARLISPRPLLTILTVASFIPFLGAITRDLNFSSAL